MLRDTQRVTRRRLVLFGATAIASATALAALSACSSPPAASPTTAPAAAAPTSPAVPTAAPAAPTAAATSAPQATAAPAATVAPAATAAPAKASVSFTAYGVIDPQISSQLLIGVKKGFFLEQGLQVDYKLIQSGADIGPLIAGGTAPLSFESNITVIDTAANGVPVHIITPSANIAGTQGSVLRKGLTLKTAKDLEGMKVGMPEGAGVILAWRNMAKDLGVDLSKIKFINLQPADSVAALGKGDIDIMSGWEPWITKSLALGGTILFTGKVSNVPGKTGAVDWEDFYSTCQVTPAFTSKYGDSVVPMLKALSSATDYINKSRADTVKLLSPELHIPEDQLTQIMGRNLYTMKVDKLFLKSDDDFAAFQVEQKAIKAAPSPSIYTDWTYLKQVDPTLVAV